MNLTVDQMNRFTELVSKAAIVLRGYSADEPLDGDAIDDGINLFSNKLKEHEGDI